MVRICGCAQLVGNEVIVHEEDHDAAGKDVRTWHSHTGNAASTFSKDRSRCTPSERLSGSAGGGRRELSSAAGRVSWGAMTQRPGSACGSTLWFPARPRPRGAVQQEAESFRRIVDLVRSIR
jgi:hypothetical protein